MCGKLMPSTGQLKMEMEMGTLCVWYRPFFFERRQSAKPVDNTSPRVLYKETLTSTSPYRPLTLTVTVAVSVSVQCVVCLCSLQAGDLLIQFEPPDGSCSERIVVE